MMDKREREERRWCKPATLKQERAGEGMTRGEELWAEGLRRLECGAAELQGYDSGAERLQMCTYQPKNWKRAE
jgi:hypothetical protein